MTIVWIASIATGLLSLNQPSKRQRWLNIITLLLLAALMSCNNNASDEINMFYNYNIAQFNPSSWAYFLLQRPFIASGVSFGWFNFVTIMAALMLIANTIAQYTNNWGFALALYSFCGSLLDASLYRQFLASSIVVFGMRYIIGSRRNAVKYMACVAVAACFHLAMGAFAIFAFSALSNTSKMRKYGLAILTLLAITLVPLTLVNDRVLPGLRFIATEIMGNEKMTYYVEMSGGRFGWIYMVVLIIVTTFLSNMLIRVADNRKQRQTIEIIETVREINYLSMLFLPFCVMYLVSFSRLFRPLIWINVLAIARVTAGGEKNKVNLLVLLASALYLGYVFLAYNWCIYDWSQSICILRGTPFWIK